MVSIVPDVEYWKKRIIEKFIERSSNISYYITDPSEILDSFGKIEFAANNAWEQLIEDELLVTSIVNGRKTTFLNHNKQLEIIKYFNQEPVDEVRERLKPSQDNFENLNERFTIVTENAWPNQGTYYLCTQMDDPTFWVALYRSKPHKKPTRINLGSLTNNESRITRMWEVIRSLGNENTTFYKKQAEDLDQQAFGNNRQPAVAAFGIFTYLGWIKEVERRGKSIIYELDKDNLYDNLINNRGHICLRCGRVLPDRYCTFCNSPI